MPTRPSPAQPGPPALVSAPMAAFYRDALAALVEAEVPFLVGGGHALSHYTGIRRYTKDLDIFLRLADRDAALAVLGGLGCRTEVTFPHWLGKALLGQHLIDVIHSSGDGVAVVDDLWFEHAERAYVLGIPVGLTPAEEMIWSKAYIMERDRFDGGDVAHLILTRGDRLRWDHILQRFRNHWQVLLVHVLLFGFAYPSRRDLIPRAVLDELLARAQVESQRQPPDGNVCLGTLLSRAYLYDVQRWGFGDGRLEPEVGVTRADLDVWIDAFPREFL